MRFAFQRTETKAQHILNIDYFNFHLTYLLLVCLYASPNQIQRMEIMSSQKTAKLIAVLLILLMIAGPAAAIGTACVVNRHAVQDSGKSEVSSSTDISPTAKKSLKLSEYNYR